MHDFIQERDSYYVLDILKAAVDAQSPPRGVRNPLCHETQSNQMRRARRGVLNFRYFTMIIFLAQLWYN